MTATGTAMVSAASVEAPERIANAVAMILPNCMFGGPAAPIATNNTRPASVLRISGLPMF